MASSLLGLGVYPAVTLATARRLREEARASLASGIDPLQAKRDERAARAAAAESTFETVARTWLAKTAANRAASTQEKNSTWLEKNVFPSIGKMPILEIAPRDVLAALQKIEARGGLESAHKIKQLCGQNFRFAVAGGLAERDVTADLRGALSAVPKAHFAAITEPAQAGQHVKTPCAAPIAPNECSTRASIRLAATRSALLASVCALANLKLGYAPV